MARNKITVPTPTPAAEQTPPEVIAKVDAIVARYTDPAGTIIGMLQDVQEAFNYLPQDALVYLSDKAEVPLSRLYTVARFYNTFSLKPRGENIIRVCLGTACHLKGAGQIAEAITRELDIEHGETTGDMKFTLEHVNCLGTCALAPVVTVNDRYYGKMTVSKMMKVVEDYATQDADAEPQQDRQEAEEAVV